MSGLGYYDHNAERYARRVGAKLDLDALREFTALLPRAARILDAGCGAGRDLRYFQARGFLVQGLEVSERLSAIARGFSGAPVLNADLRFFSPERGAFDGIWANRSLIHLTAPECQRALGIFFAALPPSGALFISIETSDGQSGEQEEALRIEDRTDDFTGPARVIYRYRQDSFASLIRQSGFKLLSIGRSIELPHRVGFLAQRI